MDIFYQVWFANDQLAARFIEEIDFDYAVSDATGAPPHRRRITRRRSGRRLACQCREGVPAPGTPEATSSVAN
jgi:hypothetical protein